MVYDCRHKGSMFAVGPCEECKKKTKSERRTIQVVCTEKENKKLDCRVRWADDGALDSPRDGDSDSEKKKSPRSILKQKANCVIVIHDSDWPPVLRNHFWSAMSSSSSPSKRQFLKELLLVVSAKWMWRKHQAWW